MSHWASCSKAAWRVLTVAVAGSLLALPSWGKVYASRDQALATAFGPGAAVERRAEYLDGGQLSRVQSMAGAGVQVRGGLVTRYSGSRDGKPLGFAYLDTHLVRTLQETVMIVVGPDDRVVSVEVLAFGEPEEYLPKTAWFEQFRDRSLNDDLAVKRGIHGITGATLSADAVTDAVRRVLAVHRVLQESGR